MKKYNNITNSNSIKAKLTDILEEIYSTEETQVLNEYRSFFKKNVGFFSRSYVAGYLIKKYIAENNKGISSKQGIKKDDHRQTNKSGNRRVSLNIGSQFSNEEEIQAYLASLPDVTHVNATLVKQTPKYTVITINAEYTKDFLTAIRNNVFKNKKLFVDLRGRY